MAPSHAEAGGGLLLLVLLLLGGPGGHHAAPVAVAGGAAVVDVVVHLDGDLLLLSKVGELGMFKQPEMEKRESN